MDPSQGDVDRSPSSPSVAAAAADDQEPGDLARGGLVGLLEAGRGALSFVNMPINIRALIFC